jgi:hypothetical protein
MCESPNLVHQKGDPYRTKGMQLRYCQIVIFQGFAAMQKQSPFGPGMATARPLLAPASKSRAATVLRVQKPG